MTDPRWEEEAALHALGMLESSSELDRQAEHDPEVGKLVRQFSSTAAFLAYAAPQVQPPAALRQRIMAEIGGRPTFAKVPAKVVAFSTWALPYAIAACLMGLVLVQGIMIARLHSRLGAEHLARVKLQEDDSMLMLRLADLKAMNASFINAKVMVAWDPMKHRGMITMADMPAPPPGQEYQLWVLDPQSKSPVSAGMLTHAQAQDFAVKPVHTMDPGFAISVEPAGGVSSPTPGAILFAVAGAQ